MICLFRALRRRRARHEWSRASTFARALAIGCANAAPRSAMES